MPDGISLNYSMLPRKLKAAGYESYHIGKWHQGLYTPQHTPVGRGFDHSYGFLEGNGESPTKKIQIPNATQTGPERIPNV